MITPNVITEKKTSSSKKIVVGERSSEFGQSADFTFSPTTPVPDSTTTVMTMMTKETDSHIDTILSS
jgi:hypothetical protein